MDTLPPAFSIIVPTYNVEEYLAECLGAILSQTFDDFELIVVDDGSTDGSTALIERYAAQDTRIRLIRQPNAGPSAARNTGVAAARGQYCLFVDSDDTPHPQLLEICHHFLQRYKADFISYNCAVVEPHAGLPGRRHTPATMRHHVSSNPYHLLAQRHPFRISLITHGTCYRTELAQKHPFLEGMIYEDYPHTVCLLQDAGLVVCLPYQLYGYTKRPGSLMHGRFTTQNIEYHRRGLLCIADAYKENASAHAIIARTIYPEYCKQIGNAIFRSTAGEEERLDLLRAFRALLQELNQRGLLRWRGHKLRRYLAYRRMMRTGEDSLHSLVARLRKVFH